MFTLVSVHIYVAIVVLRRIKKENPQTCLLSK